MKTIFIAIAFGTSVRDVLRTDIYTRLKEKYRIILLIKETKSKEIEKEFGSENVFIEELKDFRPSIIERVLMHVHKAILRRKCKTIDLGNTAGDTKILDKITPFINFLNKLFGEERLNKFLEFAYTYFTKPSLYKDVFKKYNPDLVIVTRVLNYSLDYPVLRRAAYNKIPIVCLVSSWDNFTSKGFFPFSIKSLIVWNDILKREAVELFHFPEEKIFVGGIARYDLFFKQSSFRAKEDFIRALKFDDQKAIITYATGSSATGRTKMDLTSPEPEIAEFLARSIHENRFIKQVQMIIRLHPQADINEYKHLMGSSDIFIQVPGEKTDFNDRLFKKHEDIEFGETMLYSDVVINLASTITIDASIFNTPVVCINFDFRGYRPYKYSIKRFYEFDHYKKLVSTNGFKLSSSKEELISNINQYLENPNLDSAGRNAIVNQQCYYSDGNSGKRIAEYILSVIEGK